MPILNQPASHGFHIFNNPAADTGYSPGKGFCDLPHTLAMAKRVKTAGMKFLLNFHYSDTWLTRKNSINHLHGKAPALRR